MYKHFLWNIFEKPESTGIALIFLLAIIFQSTSEGIFLSAENMSGVLGLLPEIGIVTIGVILLMISGEFDLSVGSVFALMPMAFALMVNADVPFGLAILLGLLICAFIGFVNGFLTVRFAIPSFIVTLGMMFMARSMTVVISGGFPPLLSDDVPRWIFVDSMGSGNFLRLSFVWFVGIALLATFLLSLTNFGNWTRLTGGHTKAAMSMGIPVERVKIANFMICSILAGFAGLIQVLRLNSPLPSIGVGMEMQAVAAAVIGGTALTGGVGSIFSGIVGALLIRLIENGLILVHINANWFQFVIGLLTVCAVIINSWLRQKAHRVVHAAAHH